MNFIENAPLALCCWRSSKTNGAPHLWVHVLGIILVIARVIFIPSG